MTTILYIEDNEDNIFMLTQRLGRKGYDVLIARDGEEGVAMARSVRPAVILMDLDVPVLNGWDATRLLRSVPETAQIPIIAVSAHVMPVERQQALDSGCDDFVSKPIDMTVLCNRIEALRPGTAEDS